MLSVPMDIPAENVETYRWRGDLGLLDPLSYHNSIEIPRNWSMTSLDAGRIQHRNQSSTLTLESQSMNMIFDHHNQPEENDQQGLIPIAANPGDLLPGDQDFPLTDPTKKKR